LREIRSAVWVTCVYRKSDSAILVVKSTENRP
jgi:hypothetical protein